MWETAFESKWAAVVFAVVVTVGIWLFRKFNSKKHINAKTTVDFGEDKDKIVPVLAFMLALSSLAVSAQSLDVKTYVCKKTDTQSCVLTEKPKTQPRRVIDKKFIFATSFSIGAAALDVHSSRYCETHNPRCYEAVGIFSGSRPSAVQLAAINAPMQVGVNALGYLLKKHNKKYWWAPQIAFGVLRIGIAARNYRLASR